MPGLGAFMRIFNADMVQREAKARAPEERARRLLVSRLSPQQRQCLALNGYFEVRGSATHNVYRILTHKFLGNIIDRRHGLKYCLCFADRALPTSDHILAQKLLIECNERHFLRVANATSLIKPRPARLDRVSGRRI